MPFTIHDIKMNGIKYPVGVIPLDILVSAIEKERLVESIKGVPGNINYGFDYKEREITLNFWLKHYHGEHDQKLLKSKLYAMLDSQPYFYISDDRLPTRVLKVAIDEPYMPDRINGTNIHTLEVKAQVIGLPFWQSKYTTQDVEKNSFTSIVEQFGLADGINVDYPNYSFTDNNFTVWNGGNTTIDYRNMYLKIEVQNLTTKGDFTIENLNTGDRFIFNKEVNNQNLVLNGPVITVANDNRLRDTNHAFIKLKPGENKIKISNGTFSEINFDFRYLYK